MYNEESEPMFFAPDNQVIVYSFDDDIEMGSVIHHDEIGLVLRTTHQMQVIHHTANDEQKLLVNKLFRDMNNKQLREHARSQGMGKIKSLMWKTEELRDLCVDYALSKLDKDVATLVPLSKPVKQWISSGDLKRVKDAQDFIEEGILNRLDFEFEGQ